MSYHCNATASSDLNLQDSQRYAYTHGIAVREDKATYNIYLNKSNMDKYIYFLIRFAQTKINHLSLKELFRDTNNQKVLD